MFVESVSGGQEVPRHPGTEAGRPRGALLRREGDGRLLRRAGKEVLSDVWTLVAGSAAVSLRCGNNKIWCMRPNT